MSVVKAPEWIENQAKPTDGFDILGLRLPVQAISGALLNGITTIAPRVRFLTIRSWIIKMYSESGLPFTSSAASEFASRVEAAIVFASLTANRKTLYMPGSGKAGTTLDECNDVIQIERLIDQAGFNAYAGPSYGLHISFKGEKDVPGLTEQRGVPLAEQFDHLVVDTELRKLIKENPSFDTVSLEALEGFGQAIDVDSIPDAELDFLLDAILPVSPYEKSPESLQKEINRVGVYTFYLELANLLNRAPTEFDIFDYALRLGADLHESLIPILDGYLWYRIRDVLAVVHEAVLGEVTSELQNYEGAVANVQVLRTILGEPINDILRQLKLLTPEESYEQLRYKSLLERVEDRIGPRFMERGIYRWSSELDENKLIDLAMKNKWAAVGLLPVAWIVCQCRVDGCDLDEYPELEALNYQGVGRFGLLDVVLPQLKVWHDENPTLDKVIAWQIQRTVDQHLRIAWSRMNYSVNKDIAVLACDGDNWCHRGKNYIGDQTDSRISRALGWLKQLSLVDSDGLTERGREALNRGYGILTNGGSHETA